MTLQCLPTRAAASGLAAGLLCQHLAHDIVARGEASLVVSGGSTPRACLVELGQADLDWSRVSVTLTDERCVPVTDDASNEKMVRETLMCGNAGAAQFCPLSTSTLQRLNPLTSCLVGMGEDGHFASIFPDDPALASLLDTHNAESCMPARTRVSDLPRITMTLAAILRSQCVILLAFGEAKRRVLESSAGYPVHHLLSQSSTDIHCLWAP